GRRHPPRPRLHEHRARARRVFRRRAHRRAVRVRVGHPLRTDGAVTAPRSLAVLTLACAIAAAAVPVKARRQERPPNELGRIPILEYHKVDLPEARWTRTPENFRADLERFWKGGYRLVPLTEVLAGRIATPAGTTPMVLTFDDSSPGQFHFLEKNGDYVIDPD